ncbi:serine/threonine protein kinase [Flavobacterium chryseum]|uniref:serine/threonine-protein kinase n=1 Tax=Flavobacterium sp. P3160 TaxID=2512113 RepID=UPI001060DBA8|nr:serine/threonine-protein kinase [Flavobacterium sp. P3160]TDO77602.1 serine/threonine protein kinase [Flavobacterium sp. P3160]
MEFKFIINKGNGGFGIVDKVSDTNGVEYAKKTFSINQGPSFPKELEENVKKRFIREAKIQNEINHYNIVPITHTFLEEEPPYFVMKLAEASLYEDMMKDLTLGGKFMDCILDILAGLEELHSMEIYHRDLKPANILRFKNGRDYYAIGDFGLMSINQTRLSSLTQTGMRMGSDYYTAPEIVKDLKNSSAQSDIYSIGCIIHDFIGNEERIPCGEIDEDNEYSGILRNCTRKDPSRRFKSVKDLREALLSLGEIDLSSKTTENEELFAYLEKEPEDISEDYWNKIISFIEDKFDHEDSSLLMQKITIFQLNFLLDNYINHGNRLGILYARWIRNTAFNFEYCDALSIKLSKFIDVCKLNVKSECLMAMLYLGTGHNRWYVERMFVSYVTHKMEINLAKRLAIEFITDSSKAKQAIIHLTHSISLSINTLHPQLITAYKKI